MAWASYWRASPSVSMRAHRGVQRPRRRVRRQTAQVGLAVTRPQMQRPLNIKNPYTGEPIQLSRRDIWRYRNDRPRFWRVLRERYGVPEPDPARRASDMVFYWDDHDPRRLRAFTPKA